MEDTKRIEELQNIARKLRLEIVEMTYRTGKEYKLHPGPALSIVDIITVLYFETMYIEPKTPNLRERDRLILSKGHACPALYAALSHRGYFDKSELYNIRHLGSMLQGHPDMRKTPGIDFTTGSLGHGISIGIGMAIAGKFIDKLNYHVYVIIGCGESQEGLIWEGALCAGNFKLSNLTVILDNNGFQSSGKTSEFMSIEPIAEKWKAFGWEVYEIDGHNITQILYTLKLSREISNKPILIICNTIKGKGISFMEHNNKWHQSGFEEEEYQLARKELSC